jgi:hypothetical protein
MSVMTRTGGSQLGHRRISYFGRKQAAAEFAANIAKLRDLLGRRQY